MKLLVGIAAPLALLAESALAQERVELAPYSQWVMSYDDDSCTLKRQFGDERQQAYLELRQFGPSSGMQATVASKDFRPRDGVYKVSLLPFDEEPLEFGRFDVDLNNSYKGKLFSLREGGSDPRIEAARREFAATTPVLSDEQRALVLRGLDLDGDRGDSREYERLWRNSAYQPARDTFESAFVRSETWRNLRGTLETEAEGLLIERAFNKPLLLRTGSLRAPMNAMRTCLDELYSHWGIDVQAHKTLSRPAIPLDYARIVREITETYPASMLWGGNQGSLRVRLDVAADGKPIGCHMQVQYNEEAFERVACEKLMRYALFDPALDKDGRPIASFYLVTIQYQID
jgi:hypothetical protein